LVLSELIFQHKERKKERTRKCRSSHENGNAALEKDENSENTEKPTVGFLLCGAGTLLVLFSVSYTK
jgi:hypothetical protein